MAKIGEIELICPVRLEPHDPAHRIHERWLAIRRKTHDFVLVAIMWKAQILRQGLIEHAERMRKIHPPVDRDILTLPGTPGRAGEVSEPIDRDDDGFFEWGNMEGRGEMRQMMFDLVHLTTEVLAGKVRCQ